jgi:hypothetical protein
MANNNNGYIGLAGQLLQKKDIGIGNGWKEEILNSLDTMDVELIYTKEYT